MAHYNLCIFIGNITQPPILRTTTKNVPVVNFAIALTPPRATTPMYVDVRAWDQTATNIAQYCQAGSPVHITGHLVIDSFIDRATGQKRTKPVIEVDDIQFLSRLGSNPQSAKPQSPLRSQPPEPDDDPPSQEDNERYPF